MRKFISILLITVLCLSLFCGCGSENADNGKLRIVTTIFPLYDWTMNILGDNAENAEVTMLLDSGVDLHSYQPSADDIIKIATCDVFIYVGGESDAWAADALKEAVNKDMIVVNLIDALGDLVKDEESVEGMEAEDGEEPEADEHIWLSLKNAWLCCLYISRALSEADNANAESYNRNYEAYQEKLEDLYRRYQKTASDADIDTLLFCDRFPFRYLTDDYGLYYYAAFSGCSAESEASFETVAFLAEKLNELDLPYVITLDGSDTKIAQTVIGTANSKARILTMDSMQSMTAKDVEAGNNYLDIMELNLSKLQMALGG